MLWSSKLPQDADFGSWKDDNYPKTPKGWRRQGLGTVVILWPERSREIENRTQKVYYEATTPVRKAYVEATNSAWKAFVEATAPARKAYVEATASAWKALVEATASAWRALDKATAPAQKAYNEARDEAMAPAQKAYNEATAPDRKARDEAMAPAGKAYDEAKAFARIDFDLALAENLPLLLNPPPSRIVLYNADTDKWVETPDPQEASRLASLAVWEGQKFMEKLFKGEKEVRKAFEGGEPVQFGRRRSVFVRNYRRRA